MDFTEGGANPPQEEKGSIASREGFCTSIYKKHITTCVCFIGGGDGSWHPVPPSGSVHVSSGSVWKLCWKIMLSRFKPLATIPHQKCNAGEERAGCFTLLSCWCYVAVIIIVSSWPHRVWLWHFLVILTYFKTTEPAPTQLYDNDIWI